MNRLSVFAISALLFISTNAHASTEGSVVLGPTSSDVAITNTGTGWGYGFALSLNPNLNLMTAPASQLALTGNAYVISPSTTFGPDYIPPESGLNYGNSYLSVFGHPSPQGGVLSNPTPGMAVLNLAGQHNFGFTWGSVDDGNTLTLVATNATYVLTGTDIANALLGGIPYGDADLSFTDAAGTFVEAIFTSTNNSFEAANFEIGSAVPLPAALPLFGAAVMGVGALARRRKA